MRTNRLLQLGRNDVAGALSSRTANEVHDSTTGILEGRLQQSNCDTQSDTCAAKGTLVVCHGPWITLQLLNDIGDLELSLLDGQEEAGGGGKRGPLWLLRMHTGANAGTKTQHLLHLLGSVVLVTSEYI